MASSALLNEQRLAGGVPLDDKTSAPQTYRFCYPAILHFGDPEREYQAAKSEAVLFDVSDRAQIEMTGKDGKWLTDTGGHNVMIATITSPDRFQTQPKGKHRGTAFFLIGERSLGGSWSQVQPVTCHVAGGTLW